MLEIAIRRNEAAPEILNQRQVIERQRGFLKGEYGMIADRAAFVIDAHGDLRPEHIYLLDPPVIVDRLEFNRDLRLFDPLDELAFLAIECERLGAGWIGDFGFECFREHISDQISPALIAFYKSLRACMRARLALGHVFEPRHEKNSPWFRPAEHYTATALEQVANRTV